MKFLCLCFPSFIFYLFSSITLFSQKYDYIWLYGREEFSSQNDGYGGVFFDFKENPMYVGKETWNMNFRGSVTSVSDSLGYLLFYTNGQSINNAFGELMENGEGINPGHTFNGGSPYSQAIFSLPHPEGDNQYFLFHLDKTLIQYTYYQQFYLTLIDMAANNNAGSVVNKNHLILDGKFGVADATRHGNGRDWWVILPNIRENVYNTFLVAPNGIEGPFEQVVDMDSAAFNFETWGAKLFSPDGSLYVDYDVFEGIRVFDFDRCTGQLDNFRWIEFDTLTDGSIAISPNSQFLYLSTSTAIAQYDLQADNISSSIDTVAIYDGFHSPFYSTFYRMQLAPDGKIYLITTNGELVWHIINNPNEKGEKCEVLQHGVMTPHYNTLSISHFPNYRLYDLPNSPCDTLGIDGG